MARGAWEFSRDARAPQGCGECRMAPEAPFCQHPLERPSGVRTPKYGFNQKLVRPSGNKHSTRNQPTGDAQNQVIND